MPKAERMSSVDTTWLRMDRPGNPMVIVGLFTLGGPLDLDQLEATIAERFLSVPRFRQRVEARAADYWWADDRFFDEARHIKRVRLPGKADKSELQRYVAALASEHLDKARPLWQLHIVEDYQGGAAVIFRIHHAVADGVALVGLMLSLTDGGRGHAGRRDDAEPHPWLPLPGIETLAKGAGVAAGLWKEATALAAHPAKTAKIGAGVAGELAWLLLMPEDSRTRFKGNPSGNKRVAWTDAIPLHEVKTVSKALGCTINDVLLASVAGALCQYLKDKGDRVEGVEIRAVVPVDMRRRHEAGQLGNKFGIVGVELPVGIENPLMRLYEVHRRMKALKQSLEPPVTLGMFAALGYAPQMVQDRLFNMLIRRATAVMTNVPGPQAPLYFGGAKIEQMLCWVPQSGDIGMGVSILSYNGMVQFGLVTDAQMVPDPETIIGHFRPQFEQLVYHVLMSPWGEADAKAAEHAAQPAAAPARGEPRPAAKRVRAKQKTQAAPLPEAEAPPKAEKSRPKPRAKAAKAKPTQPPPSPEAETPAPQACKPRVPSQPRTRGSKPKSAAQPHTATRTNSTARRTLPRK